MEIVRLKAMCLKLGYDIVFGEENDRLFFKDSLVSGVISTLNGMKGSVSDEMKGRAIMLTQDDEGFMGQMNDNERHEIITTLANCELILLCSVGKKLTGEMVLNAAHARVCSTQKSPNAAAYDLSAYIEGRLNSVEIVHGVLLDVFGVGVMLCGESGTGKSEIALELIGRGHLLVADDAVALRREANSLIGCSPALTRHLMDIRGIGIIDIRQMYGAGAIKIEQALELVINFEPYDERKDYRVQEEFILSGVSVPMITLPLRFGRNMAVLTEVAARNLKLNAMGYSAQDELGKRISQGKKQ